MITMKRKLAYIEAKGLRYSAKLGDPFPFYGNFDDTYQICIRSQCPVDRVFRNCGVRNSEVLLYICVLYREPMWYRGPVCKPLWHHRPVCMYLYIHMWYCIGKVSWTSLCVAIHTYVVLYREGIMDQFVCSYTYICGTV